MAHLYDRYQQGFHQEVYDELLGMREHVFDDTVYQDASLVAKEIMRRVRYNVTVIISRLQTIGYQFGEGFFDEFEDLSAEEQEMIRQDVPIFAAPTEQTLEHVAVLEQLVGTLPLSLNYWYQEVGCVNLVGSFPSFDAREIRGNYGLDPLFIFSVEMAVKMVQGYIEMGTWERDPRLPLSPDYWHKYSYGGSGPYSIALPCRAFDAHLELEWHQTTFINYLRICFQWGGFPGLALDHRLDYGTLDFLTKDLFPF